MVHNLIQDTVDWHLHLPPEIALGIATVHYHPRDIVCPVFRVRLWHIFPEASITPRRKGGQRYGIFGSSPSRIDSSSINPRCVHLQINQGRQVDRMEYVTHLL